MKHITIYVLLRNQDSLQRRYTESTCHILIHNPPPSRIDAALTTVKIHIISAKKVDVAQQEIEIVKEKTMYILNQLLDSSPLFEDGTIPRCTKSQLVQELKCKSWFSVKNLPISKFVCQAKLFHVVFDSYCELSVKEWERVRRAAKSIDVVDNYIWWCCK